MNVLVDDEHGPLHKQLISKNVQNKTTVDFKGKGKKKKKDPTFLELDSKYGNRIERKVN